MEEDSWSFELEYLSVVVNNIKERFHYCTLEVKRNSINELENVLTLVLLMEDFLQSDDDSEDSHALTQSVVELLRCANAILEETAVRPRGHMVLPITDEDLLLMYYHDFTLKAMSQVLNCSTREDCICVVAHAHTFGHFKGTWTPREMTVLLYQ